MAKKLQVYCFTMMIIRMGAGRVLVGELYLNYDESGICIRGDDSRGCARTSSFFGKWLYIVQTALSVQNQYHSD